MSSRPESYSPEMTRPFRFEDPKRHYIAIREAIDTINYRAADGQLFSGLDLNRDQNDLPPIIRITSLFTDSTETEQKYIAYQIAAAFPDTRLLQIDLPSHGMSDNLSEAQVDQVKRADGLSLVSKAHVEAVDRRLWTTSTDHAADNAVITGEGIGASMAAEFMLEAIKAKHVPNRMIGFDMVGLEKRTSLNMGIKLLRNKIQNNWQFERKNKKGVGVAGLTSKALLHGRNLERDSCKRTSKIQRRKSFQALLQRGGLLSKQTELWVLEDSLSESTSLEIDLVFGGLSKIGRYDRVSDTLDIISDKNQGRLHADVWPYDDNTLVSARHRPRLLKYMQRLLTDSETT